MQEALGHSILRPLSDQFHDLLRSAEDDPSGLISRFKAEHVSELLKFHRQSLQVFQSHIEPPKSVSSQT